jgi:hypothetical protein
MRKLGWCGVLLCGLFVQAVAAQSTVGAQQMSVGQNQSMMSALLEPVNSAPYQAEKVSHSVQTLSDGTVITHDSRGMLARDAQGRVREDIYQTQSGNVNGKQMNLELQSATVGDPMAHTMLFWTGDKTNIAMQMQLPTLPKGMNSLLTAPPPPPPPGHPVQMLKEDAPPPSVNLAHSAGSGTTPLGGIAAGASGPRDDVRTEKLGQQSLEGVLVTGTRTITTIPTGKIGNDRPIVVVHEEWRSPELKIVVKTIDKDPRTGEQTMELQNLVRTDPDPALFQAPVGYKVQDMAQMLKGLGDLGKPKPQ